MAVAEQGGNQPQRVLLIGGPKHAEYMNLPRGQIEYEFTSTKSLMPFDAKTDSAAWSRWPETATHLYRYDNTLSLVLARRQESPCNIFTHEALWNTPYQGGFNLHALSDALRALEDAKAKVESYDEALQAKQTIISDRNREIGEFQEKYEKLLGDYELLSHRMDSVRILLESVRIGLASATITTGRDYPGTIGS